MADPSLRYPQQIDVDPDIDPNDYVNETEPETESTDDDEYLTGPDED